MLSLIGSEKVAWGKEEGSGEGGGGGDVKNGAITGSSTYNPILVPKAMIYNSQYPPHLLLVY